MSFSSVSFIVFMIAVFLIYWGIPHKFRYIVLIFANLLFYGSFSPRCVPILLIEAIIAYCMGIIFDSEKWRRKWILVLGIAIAISQLLVFKYLNFSLYAIYKILNVISVPVSEHTVKLLAPIGISFYTFESLSYIVDVYNGKIRAERNGLKLFAFLSFFPKITSGPIERAGSFMPSLYEEKVFSYDDAAYGLRLILLGMVKKICGADVLKQYVDAVFSNIYAYKGPVFIIAIVLYTYEIYLDFSGYTDMARGVAYLLGFNLTENFKAPYLSCGIKDFFGRWHISLSQWLRDYIYIPLGGSRCSKLRKYVNLMITFLVSGIWHGANFTFIVWGLLHGVYQCAADIATTIRKRFIAGSESAKNASNQGGLLRFVSIAISFVMVSFAWMFFRANSLSDAKYIALNMIRGDNFYGQMLQMGFLKVSAYVCVLIIICVTIIYDVVSEKVDVVKRIGELKAPFRWVLYIALGVLVVVLRSHNGAGADFIYFKF